ncbi:hypothetical protein R1sor_022814 [Riccia sorocarpa]|uniref:Uncharacterized protein n=1 Tax=Riccia sorocarpa TaxID=122646 RepID=A0ABD3GKY4_9MARC
MEARRAAREHIRDDKFLPVSATYPIYQYQPANLSSGSPSFSLPPQFRIPFAMQGVPHFPSSMPVHRPSVVRNFMEPLPREVMPEPTSAGPSFGGAGPSFVGATLNFTDSQIPSSQEPMQENNDPFSTTPASSPAEISYDNTSLKNEYIYCAIGLVLFRVLASLAHSYDCAEKISWKPMATVFSTPNVKLFGVYVIFAWLYVRKPPSPGGLRFRFDS